MKLRSEGVNKVKLYEILQLKDFINNRIKIIRHSINRNEIKNIIESGHFELYQAYQKTNIFKDTDYIIAFRALEGRKAQICSAAGKEKAKHKGR